MTRSLNGRVAVITGAGSGMGRVMASASPRTMPRSRSGTSTARRRGDRRHGPRGRRHGDRDHRRLLGPAAIKAAADQTRRELGKIAILVNNAGIAPFDQFLEIDRRCCSSKVHQDQLRGPFLVTQEIVPDMIEAKWGRIINITSSSVQSGPEPQCHYTSSKGGLLGLTKCLAVELGEHGITANMIPPGSIDTPMLRGARSCRSARSRPMARRCRSSGSAAARTSPPPPPSSPRRKPAT